MSANGETMLTAVELATRWALHPGTLAHWRSYKRGPTYKKIGARILYALKDVEAYEKTNSITSEAASQPRVKKPTAGKATRRPRRTASL
jgi:hypothetical protein